MPMHFTKPFLLSGLLAAVVVGGLVLFTMKRAPAPSPVPPSPPVESATMPVPPAPPVTAAKIYKDDKLGFSVDYSDPVIPSNDKQDMDLSGNTIICDSGTAAVCFPYGKDQLPGRNFGGSAFSVHVLADLKTEAACDAAGNGEKPDGDVTISGTPFKKFAFGDAAMGQQFSGENYRTFRNGTCFQLSTDINTSTFENYPAGLIMLFTDEERANVQRILDGMLMSFRFN